MVSTKYIQRDLEDQIQEELSFLNNKTSIMSATTGTAKPKLRDISVSEVLSYLSKGYTRLKKKDAGYGSIQELYGLSGAQIKELFDHKHLKGKKVKVPSLNIIDDVSEEDTSASTPASAEESKLFS